MIVTPARLLRLYPGIWRLRYGIEFLALLESAPITRALVLDIVWAAAREWVTRTRVGRLFLGCATAAAALVCAVWLNQLLPSSALLGESARLRSFSSLIVATVNGFAPVWIGSLLIVMKTRRDRRFAWLGLRHELAALFLSAVWAQWAGLPAEADAGIRMTWYSSAPYASMLAWMLVSLLNVDRSREGFYAWRAPARWISSDWPDR